MYILTEMNRNWFAVPLIISSEKLSKIQRRVKDIRHWTIMANLNRAINYKNKRVTFKIWYFYNTELSNKSKKLVTDEFSTVLPNYNQRN